MSNTEKEPVWEPTPMQKCAIDTAGKTLLVSAAAGSGKTKTLTQRIIKRITKDKLDISNMLVVTFTRTAATELRSKIYDAISQELVKNPTDVNLSNQLTKLNNAKISTIDSFYLDILKSNFTEAGISSTFRIIDKNEYKLISKKIMNETIEKFYEADEKFSLFAECFSTVRSSKKLGETFLKIYSSLAKIPEGVNYIKDCSNKLSDQADLEFFETEYGKLLKKSSAEFFEHYKKVMQYTADRASIDAELNQKYRPAFLADVKFCENVLSLLNAPDCTYEKVKTTFESYSYADPIKVESATDESKLLLSIRNDFKACNDIHYNDFYISTKKTISDTMRKTASHLDTLYALLKKFDERITEEKIKLDFCTFDDISRKVYNLLIKDGEPTELAKKMSLEYSDIYIDEYQDVNRIQDDIFKAISTSTNRFMVGDIKQSIYKFRGAEPSLFSEYRKSFPSIESAQNSENATIIMSNNFRSDENVINFTNLVCAPLFKNAGGCINYTEEDNLVFTKKNQDNNKKEFKISLNAIYIPKAKKNNPLPTNEEKYSSMQWESEFIASKIKSLIDGGAKPQDITVLFRKKKMSAAISDALKKRNIKVSEISAVKYFENADVLMMLCILNAIDNPERDVYLAGTLRSPIFNFTSDELLYLRRLYSESYSLYGCLCEYLKQNKDDELSKKSKIFQDKLTYWQENSTSVSIDRFLLMLFNDDMIIASGIITNQDDNGDGGNLLLLYDYARNFQGSGFKGLYEFIEYINTLIEEDENISETTKSKAPDRVSLMTIHKSKGLEFPICFVTTCGQYFNTEESKNNLVLNYPQGIAMKLADKNGFALVDTPMRKILAHDALRKNAEEEIRTLYVALTRAKNQLFIVGTSLSSFETLSQKALVNSISNDEYATLCESNSYLDWIFLTLQNKKPDYVDVNLLTPENIKLLNCAPNEKMPSRRLCKKRCKKILNKRYTNPYKNLYEKLSESFKFEYEYNALSKIPAKLSVSQLSPNILDENDTSLDLSKKNKPATVPAFFSGVHSEPSASEIGTATHLFFQFCDFEKLKLHGIDEELARLCDLKFIPSATAKLIQKNELNKFLSSDLLKQISSSKEIIREQRFTVNIPANSFTQNEALLKQLKNESLTVQGVIDLILIDENGDIRLFDYKTDRLSKEELANPALAKAKLNELHSMQLSYYAKAIELIFEKDCKSAQIYSTHSGQLYDVDLKDYFDNVI